MSLTKVSYSLINGAPINVLDFGAKGDGIANDTAAIQSAIDFAKTQNGGVVLFPQGTFRVSSPLLVSGSNIVLQGYGADGLHDGGTGATAATKINWVGGLSVESVIKFYTLPSVTNSKINGVGLRNISINCNGLISGGINIRSVSNGVFDHITIFYPTYVGVQIINYIAGTLADATDSQLNLFSNIVIRCLDLPACVNANGFYLTSDSPGSANANASFNTFTYCEGQFVNGTGFVLDDADNNSFFSCRPQIIGTGKGLWIQGADGNLFYDFSCGGFPSKIYVSGTASGYYQNPQGNCFLFPDVGNGTTYPNLDPNCFVFWLDQGGVGVKGKFNQIAMAQSNASANSLMNNIGVTTAIIDSSSAANILLTNGGVLINSWVVGVGSGTSANDLRISTNSATGRLNLGNGAPVDIPSSAVTFANVGTTAAAANAYLDNATGNALQRSTSSVKYKTEVQTIDAPFSNAVLSLRPVWYRSLAKNDNKAWSWYGLIAEEVAQIEPRLVHWSYAEDCYDVETVINSNGVQTEYKTLKNNATLTPDGVQYERVSVLLLDVVKRQDAQIQDLTARLTQLEARIPA